MVLTFVEYAHKVSQSNLSLLSVLIFTCIMGVSNGAYPASFPTQNTKADSYSIRDSNGASCQSTIQPSATISGGIYSIDEGGKSYNNQDLYGSSINGQNKSDTGIYINISIPLGRGERVNCGRLYDLSLQEKQLEIDILRDELKALKSLKRSTTFNEKK